MSNVQRIFTSAAVIVLIRASIALEQQNDAPRDRHVKIVAFAPGVGIDFAAGQVEVSAKVVLRKGPLELFACSPHTKEHESILAVDAKPSHVFQAMGLIGIEPGHPPRFDEKADRWIATTGEPVELRVRIRDEHGERTTTPESWIRLIGKSDHPKKLHWVFAGATKNPDGHFPADTVGTVACVVDFDTSVISLDATHTSDNADLWLEADMDSIPPEGTPVTLLIRSAVRRRIEFQIGNDGSLTLSGEPISLKAAIATVNNTKTEDVTTLIAIKAAPQVPQSRIDDVTDALTGAGVQKSNITVTRAPVRPDDTEPPKRKLEKRGN
ncbi:MAG: hypothetical protein HY287_06415 [Planctomycetes bacterium]|nr:hypothetical protein [Planctomycetota bacterium]MBI3833946.1 hypothetical protein [Planctomycetota bacterium]